MYLEFIDYQQMGGALDEAAFTQYERKARRLVDWVTFGRLKNEETLPEELAGLMYDLIGLVQEQDALLGQGTDGTASGAASGAIASQSNDGVSISYNSLSADALSASLKKEAAGMILWALEGVKTSDGRKLLYRGYYPYE